jgi:hypothetical protein
MPTTKASNIYVQRFYESLRAELLAKKAVTEKKMFGTAALCSNGKVFMFPWKETLVLKLPEDTVNKLVTTNQGQLFDPGHGRKSKTWVAVFPTAKRQWPKLVGTARQFVGG